MRVLRRRRGQSPSWRGRAANATRSLRRDRTAAFVAIVLLVALAGVVAWRGGAGAVVPSISDIGAWLSSTKEGSVTHANGMSGKADAKVTLKDAQGHPLTVTQEGDAVLVTDTVTGVVSRIDPAQLTVTQSVNYGTAGAQVVTDGDLAYLIEPEHGIVQRIDVTELSAVGDPIVLNRRLGAGGIDRQGTLWVPAPDAGELMPIADGAAGTPVRVGEPGDALSLTIANGTPVATNATRDTMTVLSRTGGQVTINLPTQPDTGPSNDAKPESLLAPLATEGKVVPLVVAGTGQLVVVDTKTGTPTSVTLAGVSGNDLGSPAAAGKRIYVPDNSTGKLIVYDVGTGQLLDQIMVTGRPGKLDVFVKDGLLWANAADGPEAISVEASGKVHRIGKYDEDLPGTSPTPEQPAKEQPAEQPTSERPIAEQPKVNQPKVNQPKVNQTSQPPPAPPPPAAETSSPPPPPPPPPATIDPPGSVTQTAQAGSILVTFTPADSTGVVDYTLTGAPGSANVNPQSVPDSGPYEFTVDGLSCDNQYRFSVSANYDNGSASTTAGARVRPCGAPSEPQNLRFDTGTQHQLGVAWDAPADDGGGSVHYDVSWNGGQHTDLNRTDDTITDLANFQDYTVTVEAVNPAGSSEPPASGSVTLAPSGTWGGNVWNPLYELYLRQEENTDSPILYTFPRNSGEAVDVKCEMSGGSWVDPTGTPSGSMWYRVTSPRDGYIAEGYVRTSSEVWDGPC